MFRNNLRNVVGEYLSVPAFQEKWEGNKGIGSGYFYALTYHSILSFFKEHQPLSDALNLKMALIFSWNPSICKVTPDRFKQAKRELAALEESTREELNTKDILDVDINKLTHELWGPVKKASSSRDSTSGVSVTKFLHFSFPHIFPMIDLNTMQKLGGKTVDREWYSFFLMEWKDLYKDLKASFDQISNAVDMPVTQVLDIMIFTPKGKKRRVGGVKRNPPSLMQV